MRRFVLILAIATAIGAAAVGAPVPSLAQTTIQTQPIDPFGQEVTLAEQPIVYAAGTGEWDTALETLTEAFKTVKQYLDKAGLKAAGPAMTIYTAMDDVSFNFQAAIPVAAPPKSSADRRHPHRHLAGRQGAQVRAPRLVRRHDADLRHDLPSRG